MKEMQNRKKAEDILRSILEIVKLYKSVDGRFQGKADVGSVRRLNHLLEGINDSAGIHSNHYSGF